MTQNAWAWTLVLCADIALILFCMHVWSAQGIPAYIQILAVGGIGGITYHPFGWFFRRVVAGAVAAFHYRDPEKAG